MRRLMRAVMPAAGAILLAAGAAYCAETVRLHPYPQKFRTFYQVTNPRVPTEVKVAPGAPPQGEACCVARAGDGALWHGTRQGAVRIDNNASSLDRRQYFAGPTTRFSIWLPTTLVASGCAHEPAFRTSSCGR